MRTGVDGGTYGYYNSQRFETWERFKVTNGSGTFVDVSMRVAGYNWQPPQPNLPIGALTVDLSRDASPSLSPFVAGSTLNRLNDGTTYFPLLQVGSTVTMEVAIGQQGSGPAGRPADASPLWYEVFRGTIGNVKWGQFVTHVASITVLDLGGVLQKMKSQAAYTYTAGTAIETVAQQILTNNGATWVSFSCPVATGKVLPNDVAPGLQKTVWEQLANLFRQAGMVLWWRYSGTGTLQLTAFTPPRNKTTLDQAFSIVTDYTQLEIDENDIGSSGYIVYFDSNGVQQQIGPMVDSASVSKYGGQYGMQRPFWIVLTADSPVRDGTSAAALLTQALSDVSDPDVVATVTLPPLWFGEAAVDLYQFPTITGDLFDSPLEAAPFSITIQRQGDQQPYTTVNVRGKPSAGRKTWQLVGGGTIITSYGLNGSNLILADTIDSFQLGPTVPYVSAGGATDAWPRRPFTVNTESDLTTWSLGGLFMERAGNVAAFGPQGLENYLRFENTNTINGPNLGIISNAEMIGYGGTVVGWSGFAGGFVMNANLATVSSNVSTFVAGGVSRVSGATGVFSGKVIGFQGTIPATHAAVTGESWNLYMNGTAPNFIGGRLYIGTALGSTWMEQGGSNELKVSNILIPGTDATYDLGTTSFRWRHLRLSHDLYSERLVRSGSQTAGTGLVVGDQTAALSPGGFGSNIGLSVYADAAGVASAINYVNRSTSGAGVGAGLQWVLATSTGTLKRGGMLAVAKSAAWTDGTLTTQNTDLVAYLARDGGAVVLETMRLTSKGNLTLMGGGVGGGVGVFSMADATINPTSTPGGASILWSAGGVLKTRSAFDALGGFYVGGSQVVTPSGTLAPGSVANAAAFAASIKPIEVWTYATLPVSPAANTIVFVTDWPLGGGPTGPRMARWSGSAWVALAAADQIVGQLTAGSIAAGAITASAINVSTLSSIAVNAGTITAGVLQNGAGTRYLDLSGGTSNFLQHEKLSLTNAGGALFTGTVKMTVTGANSLEFWTGSGTTNIANISTSSYTPGSGTTAIDVRFPGISRSLAVSAQGTTIWLENVDATGVSNSALRLDSAAELSATSILLGVSGTAIGFCGTTPVARGAVTGSRGGNAALASLMTYLAARGLLTDSTT